MVLILICSFGTIPRSEIKNYNNVMRQRFNLQFLAGLFLVTTLFGQSPGIWIPPQQINWQWQLTNPVDLTVDAQVYDIDLFNNDASVVKALHDKGRKVICYVSVGTYEDWRPDAAKFPESVKGSVLPDFTNERWLDIRNLAALAPILDARFDLCKSKGFDAIEPDNVDAYANKTGFPLTAADQIKFNTYLANAAHSRGLSVGLKNDLDQVKELQPLFDWALNEQCFQYKECSALKPFLDAGKAVFEVEYKLTVSQFCTEANAMNINAQRKNLGLDASRTPCRTISVAPRIAGIANAASYSTKAVSPGLLVAVFGTSLGNITFDGIAAPVIYNTGDQAVVVTPYSVAGKATTDVAVESNGVKSTVFSMPVAVAAPAIFTSLATGTGQIAMLNQDATFNGVTQPAPAGSIVTFYATGEGQTTPVGADGRVNLPVLPKPILPVSVMIGGYSAEVLYGGAAPGTISGVMQVNARVPDAVVSSGAVPVVLVVGGIASQDSAILAVRSEPRP